MSRTPWQRFINRKRAEYNAMSVADLRLAIEDCQHKLPDVFSKTWKRYLICCQTMALIELDRKTCKY